MMTHYEPKNGHRPKSRLTELKNSKLHFIPKNDQICVGVNHVIQI